uniref:Uncharacterized protein n=1 Tax=Arundo donax TaxID=35708 RepID=A0A0A9C4X2_ARUDO
MVGRQLAARFVQQHPEWPQLLELSSKMELPAPGSNSKPPKSWSPVWAWLSTY